MAKSHRYEVLLIALIVVLGALLVRALYIPPAAEQHVEAAAERYDLDLAEPNRWFSAWAVGDGQAFALIAVDPSGQKLAEEIGEPAYRFSRAGFGWLAWGTSLGDERWVAYGLGLASGLAMLAVLAATIWLRPRLGPRAWLIVLNPALYLGFGGDTAEPLAIAFLVMALATGSIWWAVLLGVTRPSYLIAMLNRRRLLVAGLVAAGSLTVYSLLQFGTESFLPSGGRVGWPLVAYFEHPSLAGWALVLVATLTIVIGVRSRDLVWVVAGILVLVFGSDVTRDPVNAWRAAGMLPVLWAFGPGYRPVVNESVPDAAKGSVAA